jgi:CheY-like chemotaxis protein
MHRQIFIVEDSKTDLFLIREAIQMAGVDGDLHFANDGQEATKFIADADADPAAPCPDLVLLDLNLPKRNGEDVLRSLRQSARCRDVIVVVVSSSDTPKDRTGIDGLGVAAYFKKPSDFSEYMKLGPLVKTLLSAPTSTGAI